MILAHSAWCCHRAPAVERGAGTVATFSAFIAVNVIRAFCLTITTPHLVIAVGHSPIYWMALSCIPYPEAPIQLLLQPYLAIILAGLPQASAHPSESFQP